MRFALLAATAALTFAAPVEAADYIRYDFTAILSGTSYGSGYEVFQQDFSFIVPLDQVVTLPNGSSSYEPASYGSAYASASASYISFGVTYMETRFTAAPCSYRGGPAFVAYSDDCGSILYTNDKYHADFRYSGRMLSFVGTEFDGPSPFVGLRFGATSAPSVPEPATWAMMIAGFGLVGGAMRSRRYKSQPARAAKP